MSIIAQIVVGIVALIHVGILMLEMFFWDKEPGMRVFRTEPDFAAASKVLAANQGLYNGFLAAGLVWALVPIGVETAASAVASFFLCCVIVAGIYGAATVSRRILYVQALPALIGLALVWIVPV
jgi:putative membrane protein